MQRYEHALATSRFSRRSLLIGGSAAAVALALPGTIQAARYPTPRQYLHQEWLVDAGWVMQQFDVIKIVALTPSDEFESGHIPGAARIDWPDLLFRPTTSASVDSWQSNVTEQLRLLNITPGDRVVLYDGGTLLAARLWWILDMLGHTNKHLLNGGLAAWVAAQGPIETGPSTAPAAPNLYTGTLDMSKLAIQGDVMGALNNPAAAIIDARDLSEFEAGRIPSAINYSFLKNAEEGPVKVVKAADVLSSAYTGLGITPDKDVITYCVTGERACMSYFTLRLLGYPNVRVYAGSWDEWSSSAYAPIEFGTDDTEPEDLSDQSRFPTCARCSFEIS
jgi:thiosulfate/3-mercaptopyruvate sulfurtransferase